MATTKTEAKAPPAEAEKPASDKAVATAEQFDISQYAGAGTEGQDSKDIAIPFLKVLQPLSPELDETDGKYIPEAKQGQLLNSVTGQLYDGKTGLLFVPCYYERKQLRWGARGQGSGGFKGEMTEVEVAQAREANTLVNFEGRDYFTQDGKVDPKKNDRLSDSRLHYGLVLKDDGSLPSRVLLSLTSTQIKKSKLFNALMRERTLELPGGKLAIAPTFGYSYRLTTVKESNDQGSWYGLAIALNDKVQTKFIFDMGAAFYEGIKNNEVKVDLSQAEAGGAAGAAAADHDPDKF
jgi:hypothetical protein